MSKLQILALVVVIVIGLSAVLCYATLWAEPREEDPPAPPVRDVADFDEERL